MQTPIKINDLEFTPEAVVLKVPVPLGLAENFVQENLVKLARWAKECGLARTEVHYLGQRRPFKVLASMADEAPTTASPLLHLESPITPTLGLSRALATIAENPSEMWFLHRISPDLNRMTQIAVSESAASLIIGATPRQALNRDRRDYMLPDQLAELQRLMRQGMSLGSSLETRWVGFSPVTRSNWRKFTYNYSIVDVLPDGSVIQLGKCLGVEPVAEPVRR